MVSFHSSHRKLAVILEVTLLVAGTQLVLSTVQAGCKEVETRP
jgi:hypothetical protein